MIMAVKEEEKGSAITNRKKRLQDWAKKQQVTANNLGDLLSEEERKGETHLGKSRD